MPRSYESITLGEGKRMLSAAEAKAASSGIAYNLAVVDAGGHLVVFVRQDGALRGSIDLAIDKAVTARIFDKTTAYLATLAQPGQPLFGIHESNAGRTVIFGGCVPITFNGNIVGAVAASAGKYLKKSVLELGGADVFAVLDDADLDQAAAAGADARLNGAGQVCNGAKRFLVQQKVSAEFLAKFTAILANTKVGDPMDERVGLGPLRSVEARDDLAAQVDRAVKAGATLHFGGSAIKGPGAFLQPTILTNITRDNPAYFEEFFGPVAQFYVVRDDEEMVALANDSHFGLSGAIFTSDIERAKALASRLETGSVWINTRSSTAPELPFGGVKRSGYGRELSGFGIKELVNQQMVVVANA